MILNKNLFEKQAIKEFTELDDEFEYYEIPASMYKVLALKFNEGEYFVPSGDEMKTELYIRNTKLIIKNTGDFIVGDTIELKYIGFTSHTATTQELDFPDEWLRLLTLHIKRKAFGRKNKLMSQLEFAEYNDLRRLWSIENGKVRKKSSISFNSFGFGRR